MKKLLSCPVCEHKPQLVRERNTENLWIAYVYCKYCDLKGKKAVSSSFNRARREACKNWNRAHPQLSQP